MKINAANCFKTAALALLALFILNSQLSTASAQGTAFTYQGRLQNNGSPANGSYDLAFTLFNTNVTGVAIAGPVTNSATAVINGLFTTTVDFGAGVFTGNNYWLEVAVQTNGGNGFTTLSPRQAITPTPYAIYAATASANSLNSIGNTNGGTGNFFIGSAGNGATSGFNNTGIGLGALANNTSGTGNTANGSDALDSNADGSENTADGYNALYLNTSGYANTANGWETLFSNTNGNYNTANGEQALYHNKSGSGNTANGGQALFSNTTGSFNTANGTQALFSNTTGGENTANGFNALFSNTSGYANTANGLGALSYNTSGSDNTANGDEALYHNTTGSFNTANGSYALYYNTSGSGNIANGYYALENNFAGTNNIAFGYYAGGNILAGNNNIDIGNQGVSGDTGIIRIGDVQTATYLAGTVYANGISIASDRNLKEQFKSVNAQAVLDKVAALPVTEWKFKADTGVQHIGPMAQDFQAAFQLSADDRHISVGDEGGVALAAIQGLNQKVELENAALRAENEGLKLRLAALEKIVLNHKSN